MAVDDVTIISFMQSWLERAVIGLNLCPFAKSVVVKNQVRYVVSRAQADASALDDLERELAFLINADSVEVDTTLLVFPDMLADFEDFVRFLDLVEVVLRLHGMTGVLQVASFHPHFVFAGLEDDDIANCTNRAPFPTLHLLRESTLDKATAAFPEASSIYERNIATMRALGPAGWSALQEEITTRKK